MTASIIAGKPKQDNLQESAVDGIVGFDGGVLLSPSVVYCDCSGLGIFLIGAIKKNIELR